MRSSMIVGSPMSNSCNARQPACFWLSASFGRLDCFGLQVWLGPQALRHRDVLLQPKHIWTGSETRRVATQLNWMEATVSPSRQSNKLCISTSLACHEAQTSLWPAHGAASMSFFSVFHDLRNGIARLTKPRMKCLSTLSRAVSAVVLLSKLHASICSPGSGWDPQHSAASSGTSSWYFRFGHPVPSLLIIRSCTVPGSSSCLLSLLQTKSAMRGQRKKLPSSCMTTGLL